MKSIIFNIFLLMPFSCVFAQNENILIEYKLNYKISKNDSLDIKKENFYLIIGKNISEYISKNKYIADSIAATSNNITDIYKIPKTKFKYRINKIIKDSLLIYKSDFGIYRYKYKDKLPKLNWKLLNKTDTISGFVCNVAQVSFAGRNYTAYYSKEISIPEGPYKFFGLPGLILKIYDDKKDYAFEVVRITYNTIAKIDSIKEDGFDEISKTQYFDFIKRVKEKPSILFMNDKISFPKEGLDKIDRRQKGKNEYENNPIELTD